MEYGGNVKLISEALKSRSTKIATGAVGGAGIMAVALNLLSARIDSIEKTVEGNKTLVLNIVDEKNNQVLNKLVNMEDSQKDLKDIIIRIDNRVFELVKNGKFSFKEVSKNLYTKKDSVKNNQKTN